MDIGPLISFSAGIASVISPCVLPLIPVVVGHSLLRRTPYQTLSFVGGFFLVFTLIIMFTALFTAAVNYYLFYFKVAAAIIIIAIGIFLIIYKNALQVSYIPQYRNTVLGSFLMGFLTSLAWSPCYGSYLIALIAYSASKGDIIYSTLNLIFFTAGFSFTIFIIAILASRVDLNRLTNFLRWIRIISGVIISIAGIYMLFTLL
jgi:cytochrome c-type biogenesis protein